MSLLRIPKGLLKLLVFLILLAVGTVIAAVRTQAGRDLLALQIESAFSNAFLGSLEIGRLRGDVLNRLVATDVQLRAPDGSLAVHVDSLVVRLALVDALRRDITIRSAEFVRPEVLAERSPDGSWNLAEVFRGRRQPSGERSKWRLRSADVRLRGGSIVTRNKGEVPAPVQEDHIFDYTNATYADVHGRLTADLGPETRLLDVINFGGRIVDTDLELTDLHGQVISTDSTLTLSALRFETKASLVSVSAGLSGFGSLGDLPDNLPSEAGIELSVDAARIDSLEIATLFPKLRLPTSSLSVEVDGIQRALEVGRLVIVVGENRLEGSGMVNGLPDSAAFHLNIDAASVEPGQIARLAGDAGGLDFLYRVPTQNLTGRLSGSVPLDTERPLDDVTASASLQAASRLGILDGNFSFDGSEMDGASYEADLNLFDFRIGQLVSVLGPGSVWNGHLTLRGQGLELADLQSEAQLVLSQSTVRSLSFDNLVLNATAVDGTVSSSLSGQGIHGGVELSAKVNLTDPVTLVEASTSADGLDLLRAVTGAPSETSMAITFDSRLTARGTSIDDLSGLASVSVDTVIFRAPGDTSGLPPSVHRVELSHPSDRETSLVVRGDIFEGELEGSYTFGSLSRVVSLWLGAAYRTLGEQIAKELHPEPLEGPSPELATHFREQNEARAFLNEQGFTDGLQFTGGLRVNRMLELNHLSGLLPRFASNVSLETTGRITPDDIAIQIALDADSLREGAAEIDGMEGTIDIRGSYAGILEDLVDSDLDLRARRVGLGANDVRDLSIRFAYGNRSGSLSIGSAVEEGGIVGVGLEAGLNVLPDRNEIVVSEAFMRHTEYSWQLMPEAVFDIYGDALGIHGLDLVNTDAAGSEGRPQRLSVNGVVSDYYADSLRIEAEDVSLDQISELVDFRDHLGGVLDASVNVAHVTRRPELVGTIQVDRLTYVYRDIGDLSIVSSYSGQGESISVDAVITQPRDDGRMIKGNEARVWGSIAIPGPDSDVPFGALDINVEADEVDLFFFEVLFTNELRDVSGKAAGTGTVTGRLSKPIFNADIQVLESDFTSPPFNLRFGLSGPVTVDSLGFHIHDAELTDPTGGRGMLRGDILFNDYRFFSFNLSADLQELMIMNVARAEDLAFYGEVWVSGSATLTGPLQRTEFRSTDAVTSPKSRLYLPVTDDIIESDQTFIVFTDSTGAYEIKERRTMLDARPRTEREFIEGMNMNFNITIPAESNVYLVFDALLGDMIQARGSGRVQFMRFEGDYSAFGTFTVSAGDYLFTAGDVFQRRFLLDPGGTITWDGDPVNAALSIPATYRTRASLAGLPGQNPDDRVPIRVNMTVEGRLLTPDVGLQIALDVDRREGVVIPPGLEAAFNREDRAAEYATSVLLTNTFLLTSSSEADPTSSADDLFFNSLSHLVSSQLNRFVSEALDLDVNVGVQQGRTESAYDLVYGFALRLDDQGIVIRGEGLYETTTTASSSEGIQGEFVVEYRLTPKVRLELFFRRESDLYRAASTLGTSYGAGIVYQTDFANWKSFGRRSGPPDVPGEQPEDGEGENGDESVVESEGVRSED
jgi:hypothetical protein